MITKLNPAALNPDWGGVLCLELGSQKPDNFDEILKKLEDVFNSKKHFLISIFDEYEGRYLGDAEMVFKGDSGFILQQIRLNSKGTVSSYSYEFSKDGTYRRIYYEQNFNALQTQIDELKQKLNEITQTE